MYYNPPRGAAVTESDLSLRTLSPEVAKTPEDALAELRNDDNFAHKIESKLIQKVVTRSYNRAVTRQPER